MNDESVTSAVMPEEVPRGGYCWGVFAALWIPYALLVYRFWFVTDDALISFRYAQNLVRGHGLRFNLGEHTPVEGYSNFLWVMVGAVFEFFRLNINLWPLLVSFACGTLLLWLVFDTIRRRLELGTPLAALATLTLACFPPFALWTTSGMETVPFALLVFVIFERLILRREMPCGAITGIAGLLLALIRLEGIAWVVVLLILAIVSRRIARQRCPKQIGICALIVGVGYAIYFGWRFWYFQELLPNTAYAKAELDLNRLARGFNYVFSFGLAFISPLLITISSWFALCRKRRAIGVAIAAMAWGFPAYAVVVTGDFMAMGRFMIPGLAFSTILLGWLFHDLRGKSTFRSGITYCFASALIGVSLLPAWNRHLVPQDIRERFRFRFNKPEFDSEYDRWKHQIANTTEGTQLGLALKSYVSQRELPDNPPSFVCGGIGAVAYYGNIFIYDSNGLVTPEVAHRKLDHRQKLRTPGHEKWVPSEYFLKDKPTILYAKIIVADDPRRAAAAIRRESRSMRQGFADLQLDRRYVIDFARLPADRGTETPHYIVTWTRIAADTNPNVAWQIFQQRVSLLLSGKHLSLPSPHE